MLHISKPSDVLVISVNTETSDATDMTSATNITDATKLTEHTVATEQTRQTEVTELTDISEGGVYPIFEIGGRGINIALLIFF